MVGRPTVGSPQGFGFLAVLTAFCLTLCGQSCILGEVHTKVLLGNLAVSQGDYQGATVRFLEALELGGNQEAWIRYNLGCVYHSLGESSAAQRIWKDVGHQDAMELEFALQFNQGLAWYESGRYDLAVESFRNALVLNPGSIPCKVNLELSLKKSSASQGLNPGDSPQDQRFSDGSEAQRLLEYMARREQAQGIGRNNAIQTDTSGGNDW